jgi:hypothetical protein
MQFVDEVEKDDFARKALNHVVSSGAEPLVILELLFHHVKGNYWLGASPRDWNAFKSELKALRRKALAFAATIRQLGGLRIFSIPLLTPEAFLAREGGTFAWRQTTESPVEVFWSSAAEALTKLADYITLFITEGDKTWDVRDSGR